MMKRSLVAGAVLTSILAGSAMAADMPTKSPVYRSEAFSWSGLYVGGVVGAGIVTPQFTNPVTINLSWPAGNWAFTGGGTVGHNWQWGSAVFGVEADFNWTNFDRIRLDQSFNSEFDAKWSWFSTVRGRFGLAVDRTLVYATAGVAIVDLDYRVHFQGSTCSPSTICAKLSKKEVGLALGTGLEYAWTNNWSLKAEYLFIKLPTMEGLFLRDPINFQYTTDAHFARLGLNYRFGGPAAKY
jgi:outer membrane immunogenic protein